MRDSKFRLSEEQYNEILETAKRVMSMYSEKSGLSPRQCDVQKCIPEYFKHIFQY